MDLQKMINAMNEQKAHERGNDHLTYGELIQALKAAPPDAIFDERVRGIGSWRGSYIEVALFTEEDGTTYEDEEYSGDYGSDFMLWVEKHSHSVGELPRNAHQLAELLESMIGMDFAGYKGGNYKIERYKPLWLERDSSTCASIAITGIDKDLRIIAEELDGDES